MSRFLTIPAFGFALLCFLAGCSRGGDLQKTKSGLLYRIFPGGSGPRAQQGEFLKVHFRNKVRDSVLASSFDALPTYARVDSVGDIYNPAEVFGLLGKGDSVVVVMLADSLERLQGQLPPFVRKGDRLTLELKVLDILPSEEEVRADQQALIDERKVAEVEEIEQYLSEKDIQTEKTEKGVFVQIHERGNGPAVDSGKTVHVMYTGKTFTGEVFDSNQDTTFGHSDPFVLVIGQRGAIEGWDDGLRIFNKGGRGTLYIPSMLAYGPNPPPGAPFKAYENLIFDVEVVDVTDGPAR